MTLILVLRSPFVGYVAPNVSQAYFELGMLKTNMKCICGFFPRKCRNIFDRFEACGWTGNRLHIRASAKHSTPAQDIPPPSTGQYDTQYVTPEKMLRPTVVAGKQGGGMLHLAGIEPIKWRV